jgi:nitrite reductase/ring-hydroxylating ferredoxin subunit
VTMARERTWVARLGDVPQNGVAVVSAFGRSVVLVRWNGALAAIDDECPHRSGPLSLGEVGDGTITCPLHGWMFDVRTGQPIGADASYVASVYELEVTGDDVFLAAPPGTAS